MTNDLSNFLSDLNLKILNKEHKNPNRGNQMSQPITTVFTGRVIVMTTHIKYSLEATEIVGDISS